MLEQLEPAEEAFHEAIEVARRHELFPLVVNALDQLGQLYEKAGDSHKYPTLIPQFSPISHKTVGKWGVESVPISYTP